MKPVFDLLPLNWQFFSVVGTFSAVLVAIFLPTWRERKRVKVHAMVGTLIGPGPGASEDHVVVTITNLSRGKLTITSWGAKQKGKGAKFLFVTPPSGTIPKTLDSGDYTVVWSKPLMEVKDKIADIYVTDSAGKYRWLNGRNKKFFLKSLMDNKATPDVK